MRVLLITQYFPPEIGAAASRWGDYTKILINKGHEVTVLCEMPNYPRGEYFDGYKRNWVIKEKPYDNLTIIRSAAGANDRKSTLKKIIHYLTFMISGIINVFKIKDYEIVIVSSPPLFSGMIGLFLQKFKSIQFWLDVRDLWPDSAVALNQIKKVWYISWVKNWNLQFIIQQKVSFFLSQVLKIILKMSIISILKNLC